MCQRDLRFWRPLVTNSDDLLPNAFIWTPFRPDLGQAIFEPRNTFPKLRQICFQIDSFGHLSVRIETSRELVQWRTVWYATEQVRLRQARQEVRLAHFCLCQTDVLGFGSNLSHTLSLDTCRSKWSRAAKSACFVNRNHIRYVSGDHLGVRQALKVFVLSSGTSESAQTIVFVASESSWR